MNGAKFVSYLNRNGRTHLEIYLYNDHLYAISFITEIIVNFTINISRSQIDSNFRLFGNLVI